MNKYIKILLFVFIMFFTPKVFCADYNVTSKIKATPSSSSGTYRGTEIYNTGTTNNYSTGTRYNGQLSHITFYLDSNDWNWNYNTTYTVTLNMATQDWRNHFMGPNVFRAETNGNIPSSATNMYVTNTFQFVSMYKIKFNIKTSSTMSPFTKFDIYSTNVSSTSFTGVNNWNLSSVTISTISNSTPTPSPVTPTPAPSGATNQDIINNNNTNTNNIINNQTQNTQDIINNQTQNTSDIIENANSNTESILTGLTDIQFPDCAKGNRYFIVGSDKSYISDPNGRINSNSNYFVTSPIKINPNETYTMNIVNAYNIQYGYYCFYRKNLTVISCSKYTDNTTTSYSFTSPNDSYYFRATLYKNDNVLLNATINGNTCVTNSYQSIYQDSTDEIRTRQELVNIENAMTDETAPSIDIDVDVASDTPIIDLIYMPLSFLGELLDHTDDTCQPYSIPFDFSGGNNTLTLPCINIKDYVGNDFYNIINALISFYMAYNIGLMCVTIYNNITSLKDGFSYLMASKQAEHDWAEYRAEGGDD